MAYVELNFSLDDLSATLTYLHTDAEEKTWWNKPGFHLSYMEDYPPYPYQRIKSEDGKDTGVIALIAPFYDLTYYRVWGKVTLA